MHYLEKMTFWSVDPASETVCIIKILQSVGNAEHRTICMMLHERSLLPNFPFSINILQTEDNIRNNFNVIKQSLLQMFAESFRSTLM